MAQEAFDLAEQFQTPVFVMMDLDLGMNNWMSDGFKYPDKPINRGKLLTAEKLKELGEWGRYKDVDGDGIPYRTIPGRRPAGVLHARLGPQRQGPVQRASRRLRRQHGPARAQVRDGAQVRAQAGGRDATRRRRSGSSATARRTGRSTRAAISCARRRTSRRLYFRLRAYPFNDGAGGVHRRARARLRHRAEPRRAAPAADEARSRRRIGRRSCAACCTTTACRSTPAASPTMCWRRKGSKWRRRRRPA